MRRFTRPQNFFIIINLYCIALLVELSIWDNWIIMKTFWFLSLIIYGSQVKKNLSIKEKNNYWIVKLRASF